MLKSLTTLALSLSAAAYPQQFEVASIKPTDSASNSFSSGLNTSNGRLTAINVTLKRCIMGAYGVGPNQILGGPDWLDTDRFDIDIFFCLALLRRERGRAGNERPFYCARYEAHPPSCVSRASCNIQRPPFLAVFRRVPELPDRIFRRHPSASVHRVSDGGKHRGWQFQNVTQE